MTTREKVELLIEQAAELPEEAQAELVQTLVEMRSHQLGIYHLDEDEEASIKQKDEDIRLGRFSLNQDVEDMFARYNA